MIPEDLLPAALAAFDKEIDRQVNEKADLRELDRLAAMGKAAEVVALSVRASLRDDVLAPMAALLSGAVHDINEVERNARMEAAR